MIPTTRRAMLRSAIAGAAALELGLMLPRGAFAQGTPAVTPTVSAFARDGILITPEDVSGDGARISVMSSDTFNGGHIPYSRNLKPGQLVISDTSEPALADWRDAMLTSLADVGVVPGTLVQTYDDGSLFASRLWWVLMYLGFDTPLVIDGGFPAWKAAGGDVEWAIRVSITPRPVTLPGTPAATPVVPSPRADVLATKEQVLSSLGDPGVVFVDTRSQADYEAGHIPGAVRLEYLENGTGGTPNLWKSPDALTALYAGIGATPDKRVIPYCQSGIKSSVTFFTLWLLGYDDLALYTGSWGEWSADPSNPVTTGPNP